MIASEPVADDAKNASERVADDAKDASQKLEEYKIQVQALANHYGRLWTRFNFFITLHTALMVALIGLFKDKGITWAALPIPALGVLMSLLWWVAGAQDRYLVSFYRQLISYAARRLRPEDQAWVHPGVDVDQAVLRLANAKENCPGRYTDKDDVRKAEEALGIERTWFEWRRRAVSVTRMPAIVPAIIGALWTAAVIGLALAAAV